MPFSKRAQERKDQHEADRRQERLEERAAYELERLKEEERREQARLEYEEMTAALDAAKARRDELLTRLRAQRLAERKAAEQKAAQQDNLLNLIRQAAIMANREQAAQAEKETARKERQAEEEKTARRKAALRERAITAKPVVEKVVEKPRTPDTEKPAEPDKEKRALAKKERQTAEQRAAVRKARQEEKIRVSTTVPGDAVRQRHQVDEKRSAARQVRLERLKELREASLKERPSAAAEPAREKPATENEAEKTAKLRQAARQSRLEERRRLEESRTLAEARRAASLAERIAELRQLEAARMHADARRAAGNAGRSAQLRQAENLHRKSVQLRKARQEERQRARKDRPQVDERRKTAVHGGLARTQPQRNPQADRTLLKRVPPRNPLQDPLASGILSADLPWLRASGNLITNITGDPILLRGVNLLGLDSAAPDPQRGFAVGAAITPEVIDAILSWGANAIRVAINRERVLSGAGGWSSQDYLSDLDGIIQQAAQGGAYTLLSLRRLDDAGVFGTRTGPNGQRISNFIAPQPGFEHFDMWRILGERYAQEPAVLFDLYTAPHAPLPDDTSGIESRWDLWTLWVEMSVADLRRVHPGALCFVSAMMDGTDLSGFPLLGTANRPIPNLVYTAHLYPREANPWQAIQALARAYPLLVTEWGGQALDTSWGEHAAQLLRGSGIGWTAAHWNAQPALIQIVRDRPYPSTFGALVRRALALEGEILAVTQPAEPNLLPNLSIF